MRQESGRWADAEQMPYRPRRRVRCTLPSRATGKPYLRPVIETSVINMARSSSVVQRSVQAACGWFGSHFGSRQGAEAMSVTDSSTKTPAQDVGP